MKKKIIIKIKPEDLKLRNELHFNVQKNTRMQIFKNRKKYNRKFKHKKVEEEQYMKTDQFQNGEDADAVLYTMLITAALTGKHREFEFIRCWEHRRIAKYLLKGLKVVIKNLKTMAKVTDKLIKAGQGSLVDRIYAKQLHLSVDYYKKECAIVKDMLSEYREYVCSGHIIDTFILPRLRTDYELVDYRTLPGVWMFKKPM